MKIAFNNKAYEYVKNKVSHSKYLLLWNYYYFLRKPKVKGRVPYDSPQNEAKIVKQLKESGFNLKDLTIDTAGYKEYINNAGYYRFPDYYDGGNADNFPEKSLEHYLAAKLLGLSKDDVYIDIANGYSPAPQIYNALYACDAYRQDIIFPEGIHKDTIGSWADDMPVKNDFATKMAAHCSFEHFEGDRDIKFIREAARVLKKGGKMCILPLYLFDKYAIQTDPAILWGNKPLFEQDAILHCAKWYYNRYGRFYDIAHFIARIRDNENELKLTIYIIQNEKEVSSSCHVKFVAVFEKQ